MEILILSTNTNHHNYFISQIHQKFKNTSVIFETEPVIPTYDIFHEYENLRDSFEKELWNTSINNYFKNHDKMIFYCKNINEKKVLDFINNKKFDVCLVFGTRRINKELISILPNYSFNLHGGDPQSYRGLDSHLWSIWHKDINGIRACIHKLRIILDTGEIFQLKSIKLDKIDNLYQLRSRCTNLFVEMSLELLNIINEKKDLKLINQKKIGRYYSFMPSSLKNECVKIFTHIIKTKNV